MSNNKIELDIDDEMLDFLLREGIRAKIKSEFSDKKIMVIPPEWVGVIKDNDSAIVDSSDSASLSTQETQDEEEAIEYFVGLGLESILKDRFNSIEEEFSVNGCLDTNVGVSIH
jgi:hypothetical protein